MNLQKGVPGQKNIKDDQDFAQFDDDEESDFISSGSDRGGNVMPSRSKEASNQQTEFEGGDYDSEDSQTINSHKEVTEIVLRNQRLINQKKNPVSL